MTERMCCEVSQIIKKNIKSDISIMNDIVTDIILSIDKKIGEDNLFNIKLILSELIVNSIIHGNNNDSDKNIFIYLFIDDKWIEISVSDEGEGFKYSKNLEPCTFCESGRGLLLVEGLSDHFIVYKNFITSIKYI
ncbi:MAG TPA: ATP-binding protein [Clostridiales bacterium]|nr:ATP-binding protein [Clostridiales bacterium]